MKKSVIFYILFILTLRAFAQTGYSCQKPIIVVNTTSFCSANGFYSNTNVTQNGVTWFQFTATYAAVTITVSGQGTGGTLVLPTVNMYTGCAGGPLQTINSNTYNITTLHYEGLIIGTSYYIAVSGQNKGTFTFCINNYAVASTDGEDCETARFIEDASDIHISSFLGAGKNANEAAGTCLQGGESNTTWYKWKATNNGTLVFTLVPDLTDNDLDFVLYDLDTTGDCANVNAAHALRCASGSGVQCNTGPMYYKTGLDFGATDVSEAGGCGLGQDGKVKYVDMVQGHIYGLLINNFTGSSGFTIAFKDQNGVAGTGSFTTPLSIKYQIPDCNVNKTYIFNNAETVNKQFSWDFGTGAVISEADPNGNFKVYYNTTGLRTVRLFVTNSSGKTDTAAVDIDVPEFSTPLKPDIIANKSAYCLGDTIKLSTTPVAGFTYTWTLPGGAVVTANEVVMPVNAKYQNGTYSLIARNDICVSQISTITPEVVPVPAASFSVTPKFGTITYIPASVIFTNQSISADHFLWDFGDGTTSTEAAPQHIYTKGGTYHIKLTALNNTDCFSDTTAGDLIVKYGNTIFIPTAFTPNNDGVNDKFAVSITYVSNYQIQVFNRVGKLVFQSRDPLGTWDGTYNGSPVPVGTYYYIVNATGLDGNVIKQSGYVAVLR